MKTYHIEFDTKEMAPHIVSVRVDIGTEVVRDMNAKLDISLRDHPQYPALERYVLANPSKNRG